MGFGVARRNLARRQAQPVAQPELVGLQNPGAQARQPVLGSATAGPCKVEPQGVVLGLLGVAHQQAAMVAATVAAGFGGLLPHHQLHRIAAPVAAHAVGFAGALHAGGTRQAVGARLACRQRRRGAFGGRVNHDLRGRPPDCPYAKGAQWKTCFGRQCGQALQAAPARCEGDLHGDRALCRYVGPDPLRAARLAAVVRRCVEHAQADAIAPLLAEVAQFDVKCCGSPRKMGARSY